MSASAFSLTELPVETLEQVLLHLPGQDVIRVEVVWCVTAIPHGSRLTFLYMIQINRQFRELICDSPMLQYKRELFSAGLIENPCNPCDFAQRRKLFEEYKCRWSDVGRVVKTIHELPEDLSRIHHSMETPGWNLIGYRSKSTGDGNISFVRIPPVTSQRPIERWNPPLPFPVKGFAVYPPDNLLVVAEHKER